MSHIDDRVIELARTALNFELGGEHFYRHAAEITQNPLGKAMFQRLADEESGRMEDLHTLFSAIIGSAEWNRLVAEETANSNPSNVVAEMEATVAHRGHGVVADDTQALRLAMEMQRKIIQLYKSLAAHTDDAVVAELLRKMIEEENFQYDNFQAQLDSVLNVGLWLDSPEFRMDGKF